VQEAAMTFQDFVSSNEPYLIIIKIALILVLTALAARLYRQIARKAFKSEKIHIKYLNNVAVVVIYVLGAVFALRVALPNFNSGLQTVLAGSGIAAVVLGLAAQGSLGNAIDGVFISMFRPFEVGDRVRLMSGDITGFIEDITLRHTVVRTFVNSRIIIPNSVINKEMIENSNYAESNASSFVDVTITYDSDLELAMGVMAEIVETHKDFIDVRPPQEQLGPAAKVYVRGLTWYGVDLRVSMWTQDVGSNFEACSDARERIKLEFERRGIKIARYDGQNAAKGDR
jgi:small-conductance mechanosensitive channel